MTTVYIARVLVDGKLVVDSAWASPEEAKDTIQRRVPAIAEHARAAGRKVQILALPGETSVSWMADSNGKVVPKQNMTIDWTAVEYGRLSSDGTTVTW